MVKIHPRIILSVHAKTDWTVVYYSDKDAFLNEFDDFILLTIIDGYSDFTRKKYVKSQKVMIVYGCLCEFR